MTKKLLQLTLYIFFLVILATSVSAFTIPNNAGLYMTLNTDDLTVGGDPTNEDPRETFTLSNIGGTSNVTAVLEQGIFLNRTEQDYIGTNYTTNSTLGKNGTINLWFNKTGGIGDQVLVGFTDAGYKDHLRVEVRANGDLRCFLDNEQFSYAAGIGENESHFVTIHWNENDNWGCELDGQDVINGSFGLNPQMEFYDLGLIFGAGRTEATLFDYFHGVIDEISVYNYTLGLTQKNYLYNNHTGQNPYEVTVTNTLPLNNDHDNNYTTYFQATTTGLNDNATCGLYINDVFIDNTTTLSSSLSLGVDNLTSGLKSWYYSCFGGNSTSFTYIHDQVDPIYIEQELNTDNTTQYTKEEGVGNLSVTFKGQATDFYLFGYNYSLFYPNGTLFYTNSTTNLTSTLENLTNTVSFTGEPQGIYTQQVEASDDHTDENITDYNYSIDSQSIEYETPTANVTINSLFTVNGNITTTKLDDRYSFSFGTNGTKGKWGFELSSDEMIYYREGLYNFPSFVIGGQWVDFNLEQIPNVKYTVQKKNSYLYELEIDIEEEYNVSSLNFNSIGGLNIIEKNYTFKINNFQAQAPLNPTIYNSSCFDIVVGSNSSTPIFINLSLTSDLNDDNYTHNFSLTNGVFNYLVEGGVAQYTTTSNYTIDSTLDSQQLLIGNYNWLVSSTDTTGLTNTTTSECSFNVCINNWEAVFTTCTNNSQIKTYNDTNTCLVVYDVPLDNGTVVTCDDGTLTELETIEQGKDRRVLAVILTVLMLLGMIGAGVGVFNDGVVGVVIGIVATILGVIAVNLFNGTDFTIIFIMLLIVNAILTLVNAFKVFSK